MDGEESMSTAGRRRLRVGPQVVTEWKREIVSPGIVPPLSWLIAIEREGWELTSIRPLKWPDSASGTEWIFRGDRS